MSNILLKILSMSIQASVIVLVVLVLRLLLKKTPKWITVLLWAIVAVRLVCPFSFESKISLMPSTEAISNEIIAYGATPQNNTPIVDSITPSTDNDLIEHKPMPLPDNTSAGTGKPILPILDTVWLMGITAMLIYAAVSYLRVHKRVKSAILLRDNIYRCERVSSPFVLGIIKPKIYLPVNIGEQSAEYVIAHEKAHISRFDYILKPVAFLILSLHWFNPLMWLSFILLCKDIELACDEKVIKQLNNYQRADYSEALLNLSINRFTVAACPIAFGEVGVRVRIKSVLSYKKSAFWVVVVAIMAIIATSACVLTSPLTVKAENNDTLLLKLTDTDDVRLIQDFEIIHKYGGVTTDITDSADISFLKEYTYSHEYPKQEKHKLFIFPETQMIKVMVDEKEPQTLYLMQDGSIAVQVVDNNGVAENKYDVYTADSKYALDEQALIKLIKKYGGYTIN